MQSIPNQILQARITFDASRVVCASHVEQLMQVADIRYPIVRHARSEPPPFVSRQKNSRQTTHPATNYATPKIMKAM